jgi:hypothetical protein
VLWPVVSGNFFGGAAQAAPLCFAHGYPNPLSFRRASEARQEESAVLPRAPPGACRPEAMARGSDGSGRARLPVKIIHLTKEALGVKVDP